MMTGDLVIENGDQVVQALQPILDKLAVTGSQCWDIYVWYVQLNAMLNLVWISMAVLISFGVAYKIRSYMIKNDCGDQCDKWVAPSVAGVICVLLVGAVLSLVIDSIVKILCPEYFAIQEIISQLAGVI